MIARKEIFKTLTGLFRKRDRNYVLVSQALGALIALATGKLIAVYVAPEDFGTYGLQFATLTLFFSMLVLPALQYIKASYATLLPKLGFRPFAIVLTVVLITAYCLLIGTYYSIFGAISTTLMFLLLFYLISNSLHLLLRDYLNVRNQLIDFSKLGIVRVSVSLLFIWLFFQFNADFIDHIEALWAMQIIGAMVALIMFYHTYDIPRTGIKVKFNSFLKKYVRFAWPLGFSAIWIWISNYFDRYAIEYLLTTEEVGIYSASYGVGSKFFLVLSPIFVVFATPIVFGKSGIGAKKKSLRSYGLYYTLIGIPLLSIIFYFRNDIGYLLLSNEYAEGFVLIFWIALAFFFITLAQLFELFFYSEKRTSVVLISNINSAITNVGLNVLLIPNYGIFGAAIATCAGFAVYLFTVFLFFINKGP